MSSSSGEKAHLIADSSSSSSSASSSDSSDDEGRDCDLNGGGGDAVAVGPPPAKRARLTIPESPESGGGGGGGPDAGIAKTEVRVRRACVKTAADFSSSSSKPPAFSAAADQSVRRRWRRAWPDLLLPELVGTVSTFLPVDDVPSLLLTAGPSLSRLVRGSYLRRNYAFLGTALEREYGRCLDGLGGWMDVNDDWRDMYGPVPPRAARTAPGGRAGAEGAARSSAGAGAGAPERRGARRRPAAEEDGEAGAGRGGDDDEGPTAPSNGGGGSAGDDADDDGGGAGVGGRGRVELRAAGGGPRRPPSRTDREMFDRIFDDLTVAVRLGLVAVVRHLVERRRGDVNERVRISAPSARGDDDGDGDNGDDGHGGNQNEDGDADDGGGGEHPEEEGGGGGGGNAAAAQQPRRRRRGEERVRRPLLYALFLPSPSVLRYLLSVPSLRVNFPVLDATYGCTILHLAAVGDDVPPSHLSVLLGHRDADVDVRDARGRTPLHYVCHFTPVDSAERVRALIAAGADVGAVDGFGRTPGEVLEREREGEGGEEDEEEEDDDDSDDDDDDEGADGGHDNEADGGGAAGGGDGQPPPPGRGRRGGRRRGLTGARAAMARLLREAGAAAARAATAARAAAANEEGGAAEA